MLNFDRSTVKHALQNTQNDCNQWLSHSFRVHQVVFSWGSALDPAGEALQRSPDSLAGLMGALLLRRREWEGGKGKRKMVEEMEGRPLTQIFGSVPAVRCEGMGVFISLGGVGAPVQKFGIFWH